MDLLEVKIKLKEFKEKLKSEGFPDEKIEKIHSPGIDINAITPDEIAISIIAELIKEKNSHSSSLQK